MSRRYSPPATEPLPRVLCSIAWRRDRSQLGLTRARTKYLMLFPSMRGRSRPGCSPARAQTPFGFFSRPGGLPRRFTAVIHFGGRPRRLPRPTANRSRVMIASASWSRSVRSSASIFSISILSGSPIAVWIGIHKPTATDRTLTFRAGCRAVFLTYSAGLPARSTIFSGAPDSRAMRTSGDSGNFASVLESRFT
jgi:hypothetical protein